MSRVLVPIPGFPDYSITKSGKVWSYKRQGQWLKSWLNCGGYPTLGLCMEGVYYERFVHVLLLETFVGPRPAGMDACHYNGRKTDNRLVNLRWDTRSANQYDSVRHGTHVDNRGENSFMAKLNTAQVRIIKYLLKTKEFTGREIGKIFGVHKDTISNINTNKTWRNI